MSVENNQRPFLYQRLYDYVLDEIRTGRLSTGIACRPRWSLRSSSASPHHLQEGLADAEPRRRRRADRRKRVVRRGALPALESLSSPERAPRSRRPGRSCIGFVLPAFSPAFEIGLLEGVEARAAELGLNLIVRRTHGRQDVEEQVIDSLMSSELVDGLIVFAVNGDTTTEVFSASCWTVSRSSLPTGPSTA